MADIKTKAEQLTRQTIEEMGYELVEVTYKKEFGTPTLTFFIDVDRENGITLDDCEIVSKAIDPILDAQDVTDGIPYNLNVSSPGIDRPLKLERDFVKNKGKQIDINFYAPFNGKKKLIATLLDWNDQSITVLEGKKEIIIDRKAISIIKPVIIIPNDTRK